MGDLMTLNYAVVGYRGYHIEVRWSDEDSGYIAEMLGQQKVIAGTHIDGSGEEWKNIWPLIIDMVKSKHLNKQIIEH